MAKPGLMLAIGLKPKAEKTDSSANMKAAKPVEADEDFDSSAEAAFQALKAAVMACGSEYDDE